MCTRDKTIVLIVVLLVGNALYLVVEIRQRKSRDNMVAQQTQLSESKEVKDAVALDPAIADGKFQYSVNGTDNPGFRI